MGGGNGLLTIPWLSPIMTESAGTGLTVQTILTAVSCLVGVIALIMFLARLARLRLRPTASGTAIQYCGSLALDAKRRVHLIECEGTRIMLLTGGGRDQVIARITAR